MTSKDWLVRTDHVGGVCEIALNRGPVNALTAEFLNDFAEYLEKLASDDSVKSLLISSPFKVLSAGLDLREAQAFDLTAQIAIVDGLNTGFLALYAFPKPTIIAVSGAAIAGGLFFVLASDVRIAGPRASFGLAEVRVGADFPVGPLEIARATLDSNALRRLMLTGQPMKSDQAAQAGLVDEVCPDDEVETRALKVATEMASLPPQTFARVKQQTRGDTIELIRSGIRAKADDPDQAWFNSETKAAMQRMISPK